MAERPSSVPSFHTILRHRRKILEDNLPMELSSLLIAKGIIEPADQEKLNLTRKHSGLKASQIEFADILIGIKDDWIEEEVKDFKSCLEELNEEFLITKLFVEKIDETMETEEPAETRGTSTQSGNNSTIISVQGDYNRVINNSLFEVNNHS